MNIDDLFFIKRHGGIVSKGVYGWYIYFRSHTRSCHHILNRLHYHDWSKTKYHFPKRTYHIHDPNCFPEFKYEKDLFEFCNWIEDKLNAEINIF